MSFPYIFEENFEAAGKGSFDSESDSGARLSYPLGFEVPAYRGGFTMCVNMGKNATDAYVSSTAFALSLGSSAYTRFMLRLSEDFRIGSDGSYADIFGLYSTGPALEASIQLARSDPDDLVLRTNDPSGTNLGHLPIHIGGWICVEVYQKAGSSSGQIQT